MLDTDKDLKKTPGGVMASFNYSMLDQNVKIVLVELHTNLVSTVLSFQVGWDE